MAGNSDVGYKPRYVLGDEFDMYIYVHTCACRGGKWREAQVLGEEEEEHLEAYERVLGDEFEWVWWERLVYAEHAKQVRACVGLSRFDS